MGPIHWIHRLGFAYGIYPWGNSLVMRKFDGETFLGGGRSLDDTHFQTAPFCFILYIEQWKFRCSMSFANGGPDPRCPGQTGVLFRFRQVST